MTDSVRQSAERLAAMWRVHPDHLTPGERDGCMVALSFLAEHPADDEQALNTPDAIDWLNGLSRSDGGDLSMLTVRACDDGLHLVSGDWVSPRVATKGDVRRHAASLGLTLTEVRE